MYINPNHHRWSTFVEVGEGQTPHLEVVVGVHGVCMLPPPPTSITRHVRPWRWARPNAIHAAAKPHPFLHRRFLRATVVINFKAMFKTTSRIQI